MCACVHTQYELEALWPESRESCEQVTRLRSRAGTGEAKPHSSRPRTRSPGFSELMRTSIKDGEARG